MTLETYAKCYANLRSVCVCYILKCRMTIHLSLLMMPIFQMLCIEICKLFKSSNQFRKKYIHYNHSLSKSGQAIYSLRPSTLAQWQYGYHRSSRTPCL